MVKISIFLFATLIHFSCSTIDNIALDYPNDLILKENIIHVKGVKGKSLVGTKRKLKYDKLYQGQLKEGWTITSDLFDKTPGGFFSKESFERSLYQNSGIEINEVTSKTSDKFQLSIADSSQTWVAFCLQLYEGKSTNYDIQNRIDFSKAKSQKSDFKVTFINVTDTTKTKWELELKYNRETPNGIISAFLNEGMANEKGQLTNGKDTIIIKPLFIKGKQLENNQYAEIIKIVGGYEFIVSNKTIGIVDLYKQSISYMEGEHEFNLITTVASTALLVRNR